MKHFLFILTLALMPMHLNADILSDSDSDFLSPSEAFKISIREVDKNHLEVKWDIAKGYYLYVGMFEFNINDSKTQITKINMPDGIKKTDEFFGDVDVYYNTTKADIYIDKLHSNSKLIVKYQGCADAGLCYPPITQEFFLNEYTFSDYYFKKTNLSANHNLISQQLFEQSVILNIILFFIAGILLSFTPCVFPMIPILTGLIVGQGNNITTRKSFLLSATYVLSMSLTYALAGILIALSGSNIQADLQNPYVLSGFAILFIILSLSMFNIITLQMPRFIQNLLISKSNEKKSGTYVGVGIMGSLSALIVGPCVTAPLIGALIYIATTNDYLIGGAALFSLGLGMGMPLLILGTSASELIKRFGSYLQIINKIFGALFLVVAIWLIERIVSIQIAAYLWAILSLLIALIYTKSLTHKSLINLTPLFLLIFYSTLQIYGVNSHKTFDPVTSFIEKESPNKFIEVTETQELYSRIKNASTITMVDLYADWCVACKELDKYTFSNEEVALRLKNLNLIKLDITKTNNDNTKFLKDHKLFGPPAILFFNRDGKEIRTARIVGFIDAETFLEKYTKLNETIASNNLNPL